MPEQSVVIGSTVRSLHTWTTQGQPRIPPRYPTLSQTARGSPPRNHDATIIFTTGNYVHDNGDAGLAMLESFRADVSDNTFENNKYGVRFSVACADNVFSNNIISNNTK